MIKNNRAKKKIAIIGSGFSGLSSACYLASYGYEVYVFEKNDEVGGRARMFESENGFKFDMGPSWYWMPDVFERFFADFGHKTSDYYKLIKLSPGFQVIFDRDDVISIEESFEEIKNTFESIEKGSAEKLEKYIINSEFKYNISMSSLVFKPSHSFLEFIKWDIIKNVFKTNLFEPLSIEIRKLFKDKRLIKIMEFPVIFLGAMATKIPALYSIMNFAALKQGTFYPDGGMVKIVEGMHSLAISLGVKIKTAANVEKIIIENSKAIALIVNGEQIAFDAIVSSADYHHTEQSLLHPEYRNYTDEYWDKKVFAPSSLLFYLGIDKTLNKLKHHNLFFDTDFEQHSADIYSDPKWPEEPLFYVCCPSKTDSTVAPKNQENVFILIPIAIGLEDTPEIRELYFEKTMKRLESFCGQEIKSSVIYKRDYCAKEFNSDYNSYKGNAYGLANTLLQTAFLKPKIKNKKIKNLFYAGQLTVPGPGVPPSLISGKIVATELNKYLSSI